MWPYSNEEHVWLEPSNEWADKRPAAFHLPTPANDTDGTWHYLAANEPAEDKRPIDPQIFIGK